MSYETNLIDYINLLERSANTRPLVLGGITSSGGGDGGPPGGFVGYLPQTRISYDLTELATMDTVISGESLLDNLNHIRYRLEVVESGGVSGGGHVIQDTGTPFPQRANLNFEGSGVIVVDDGVNDATVVTISVSGGGGIEEAPIDGLQYARKDGDWYVIYSGGYSHPNHTGEVTSIGDGVTSIALDAVTNTKLANMAQNTIKGRVTTSTGDPEDLTATNVRTIINVADGATANAKATATEVDTGADDTKFTTTAAIAGSHNVPHVVPGSDGNVLTSNGTDWISEAPTGGGVVATGAELDTGTDNAKFASALALANSHYIPTVSPATTGNVLTANGTDWISSAPSGGTKATSAEVDTGTDDAKFVTALAISGSHNVPHVVPSTAGKLMTSDGTDWISVAPANVLFIDQAGGTSDTYGVLGGTRNGSNTLFTVSQGAYNSGTLRVFLNGQMLTQGSAEDWVETAPGSGTFTFAVAPEATDEITAVYGYQAISGIISEAPIDGTPYARQDAGWVAGGGSGNAPGWVQDKFNGNSVSTVTLDTAPLVGHSLILFGNVYNTGAVSAVSSTNTTWTRVIGPYHPDQAYYDIWIGVCGTSPGSVITITHADAYASFQVIEISDVLTPTAGQTLTATGVSTGELTGVTVGHIVAVAASNDNSLTTVTIAPVEPGHLVTPDSARGVGVGYGPLYVVFASTSVVKCSVASETALLMVELS